MSDNPRRRLSGRTLSQILLSNVLLAVSFWVAREWLLVQEVGTFWVLMRVLAFNGLGVLIKEFFMGDMSKAVSVASSAKVSAHFDLASFYY